MRGGLRMRGKGVGGQTPPAQSQIMKSDGKLSTSNIPTLNSSSFQANINYFQRQCGACISSETRSKC